MSRYKPVLVHHGILGMRWGVRRFQNKDGSYTAAGKKRYSIKDVENDLNSAIKSNSATYERIKSNTSKLTAQSKSLIQDYKNEFKEAKLSEQGKKRILGNAKGYIKGFGLNRYDNEEEYNNVIEELARSQLMDSLSPSMKAKRKDFTKNRSDHYKDIDSISREIERKYFYEDLRGNFKAGYDVARDLINNKFGTEKISKFVNHIDDQLENTSEYRSAVSRIKNQLPSMKEFNKHVDEYNENAKGYDYD